LMWAVQKGQMEAVMLLIEKGEDINAKDSNGNSLLHQVIANANLAMVKMLLEKGANINLLNDQQVSPLYYSLGYAGHCDMNIVKLLVDGGANVNIPMYNGDTPMHMACYCANKEAMEILLSKGAGINIANQQGDIPLYSLLQQANLEDEQKLEAVKYLLSMGAAVHYINSNGNTALDIATGQCKEEIAKYLNSQIAEQASIVLSKDSATSKVQVFYKLSSIEE
jgi:ankyrin repeat protein